MSAVNKHRERFPDTMSNDDLKEQEGDFATNCDNPMEGYSKSIIQNLNKSSKTIQEHEPCTMIIEKAININY